MKSNGQHIENNKLIEKLIEERAAKFSVSNRKSKEIVWRELSAKLDDKSENSTIKGNGIHIAFKIAAAAVIIISIGVSFLFSDSKISTHYAETKMIYLPDGSSVFLQADSKISFNEKRWNTERDVKLEGEAYFSVKKGSTFTVKTKNGNIKVLGTRFNVLSRAKSFVVACVSGKVRVNIKNRSKSKILTKGLQTLKDKSGELMEPFFVNQEQIINRQEGQFYFEQADLNLVFEEFERQFDIDIEYTEVKSRKFTGYFSNNDVETALKMICKPMSLDYQIDDGLVVINDLAKSNQ